MLYDVNRVYIYVYMGQYVGHWVSIWVSRSLHWTLIITLVVEANRNECSNDTSVIVNLTFWVLCYALCSAAVLTQSVTDGKRWPGEFTRLLYCLMSDAFRSDGQRALFLLRRWSEALATQRRPLDWTSTLVSTMSVRHRARRTTSESKKRGKFLLLSAIVFMTVLCKGPYTLTSFVVPVAGASFWCQLPADE